MSRKDAQKAINEEVQAMYDKSMAEFSYGECERLRTCSAWVYRSENYIFLRSYNTIIACIDIHTRILYDWLRLVYGYTSTSARHIAKFRHDYYSFDSLTYYPA